MTEVGAAKTWVLAFLLVAGAGLGALVGIGCAVGANTCPFGSSQKQTSTDGHVLYLANCAHCHGLDGKGMSGAPSLVTGELSTLDAAELAQKVSRGRPLGGMPAFKRSLSDEQIRAVARYLTALRGTP